ncbi:MAG: hypothetical protein ACO1TE_02715 [Prosthecobacter sp.]
MNSKQRLQAWAHDWSAHRLLEQNPPSAPEPPAPGDSGPGGGLFTVGIGGGMAGTLLSQLSSSIAPDDAQRAEREGAYIVSPAGLRAPRVPLLRGQIRQLNPELKPAWTRTVIVLVLTVDEKGQQALVAPFSQFDQPAFDGELATGLKDESLSVLCLWNSTRIPLAALRRSWWLMDSFDDLLADADTFHAARNKREPLPATLKDRLGPPIIHPLDPRHDYLDVEAGLLEDLSTEIS